MMSSHERTDNRKSTDERMCSSYQQELSLLFQQLSEAAEKLSNEPEDSAESPKCM